MISCDTVCMQIGKWKPQRSPLHHDKKKILTETVLVWLGVIVLIRILSVLQETNSTILQTLGSLSAIVLIYPPVLLAMFQKKAIPYWRINAGVLQKSFIWFDVAVLAVFPVAFVANHFYQDFIFGYSWHAAQAGVLGFYAISQLLLVAFPEEFFFRGYMQEHLSEIFVVNQKILGVNFGMPQVLTSLVFALSHSFITVQWWHILIFFPSLVFAWLKEKTGTIWAGAMFHATCNVFSFWVALSYG